MAGLVSTAPAVKAFLLTLFTTAAATVPAPSGDQAAMLVQYGMPGPYQPDDIIAIGDVRRTVESHAMVGSGATGALIENYLVEYWVDVFRGDDLPQQVEERAYTILGALEKAVRDDPSLGGLVLFAWPRSSDARSEWDEAHKGRHTIIRAELRVEATL